MTGWYAFCIALATSASLVFRGLGLWRTRVRKEVCYAMLTSQSLALPCDIIQVRGDRRTNIRVGYSSQQKAKQGDGQDGRVY